MDKIKAACEAYLAFIESDESTVDEREDYENDIFEAAMGAVFGADIWPRVNASL